MVKRAQVFGGPWTDRKLKMIDEYLRAYRTVFKNFHFHLLYIDAFAGTGYRLSRGARTAHEDDNRSLLDEDSALRADREIMAKGSARIALDIDPPFHEYVFIEKHRENFEALKHLGSEFPQRPIHFQNEDANVAIARLCEEINWRRSRAVAFLDPFATQVDWTTIERIAGTEAIDLFYLFPVMAVNRLLTKSGKMPETFKRALDRIFGERDWYEAFYPPLPM